MTKKLYLNSLLRYDRILFSKTLRMILGPILLPGQWVLGSLPLGVKWPVAKGNNSLLSKEEVKNDKHQLLDMH